MVKNLKLNIKNLQIAAALKQEKKKPSAEEEKKDKIAKKTTKAPTKKATNVVKEKAPSQKALLVNEEKKLQEATVLPKKPRARILPAEPTPSLPSEKAPEIEEIPLKKEDESPSLPKPPLEPLSPLIKEEKSTLEEKEAPSSVAKERKKLEGFVPPQKSKGVSGEEKVSPRKEEPFREFKDFKSFKKIEAHKAFDSRDRMGLREEEERWRKKRSHAKKIVKEELQILRPTQLKVRLPISLKDLASEMKLKASELIAKLFSQGVLVTLNDFLDDETTVQLLGHEFGCEITIDTREEERLRITDKTIQQEIQESPKENLTTRPPIVTFMGHVDHGKTSLIDKIRSTNIASQEAGAITQHIGAFSAKTPTGMITILDTPGHEAFSEMRSRGAMVTDIVVLVIAGDEGIREQTEEAIRQAREAKVPIIVALNKSDKAGFDSEKVFRQLADHELLPEAWGGSTIVVSCSAVTGKGITDLLEMLSLQAEILELFANPEERARGTILESEMHKGLGAIAVMLIQNGTLHAGDAIVFGNHYGRVKTLHDSQGTVIKEASPSTPVRITGLSDLAEAGCEFIVVKNERQARELAQAREVGTQRKKFLQLKKGSLEGILGEVKEKKILPLILRADVQGSLEALKTSLSKISSQKVDLNIISAEVGEISESDVEFAAASKATIIGFHTGIESHADSLIKQMKVTVRLHDIIYHAIDDVKSLMVALLDKIAVEQEAGAALIKNIFKSSHLGLIAGCQVTEGSIKRNHFVRLVRGGEVLWKGKIASLKKVKEDVKEVSKGSECGIVLENAPEIKEGDLLQTYEISYLEPTL